MNKTLNIISFDVPFPPNYGGVIDVFYRLKALHKLGINIILHIYEYGRGEQKELEKYCKEILYYKRNIKVNSAISIIPFIVKTRADENLIQNLSSNNYPILFEGIHTTYPLLKNSFKDRIILVRAHNIEHNYYKGLGKSNYNVLKKLFFYSEAYKLLQFQKIFKKVNYILTISPLEHNYFLTKFPSKAIYISAFHEHKKVTSLEGNGEFALYHGDLRVSDNLKACFYLIKIFKKTSYPLVIASDFNNPKLLKKINKYPNISLNQLSKNNELTRLLKTAHINILPTFQNTGIKLKLINALFNGRFCLVNNKMIKNTGLESLCSIANSEKEFIQQITKLSHQKFTNKNFLEREKTLKTFDNLKSAQKILNLLN